MHDDVWDAGGGRPDELAAALQEALTERDRAASAGQQAGYLEQRVRGIAAERERRATVVGDAGRWVPDKWERLVEAVTEHRDRVAASVDGPVPLFGTPEWVAAADEVKAASQARAEQVRAVEQGKQVSARMAADPVSVASHRAMLRWIGEDTPPLQMPTPLREDVRAQREADAERRRSLPQPWEDGYAESFASKVPAPRSPLKRQECLQRDRTAAAVADAHEACRDAVKAHQEEERAGEPAQWADVEADVDVRERF